jgi:predicted DNA-binding transcriptional regulator YafY
VVSKDPIPRTPGGIAINKRFGPTSRTAGWGVIAKVTRHGFDKQDRVLRLLREVTLFQAVPYGLTSGQIAERMEINQRTAQRDIAALESELRVPFIKHGARWQIVPDYWLPPVNLNVQEMVSLLLAARLMLRFADRANPFAVAAFEKLSAALPKAMRPALMEIGDEMAEKPIDPTYTRALAALTMAWAERRQVAITYTMKNTFERRLWPLFLEPSATGHTCYLMAWDPKPREVRIYKVERISAVTVLDERFSPPLGFSVRDHLAGAWGIWSSAEPVEVELLFKRDAVRRAKETIWHPSQRTGTLPDGRLRVTFRVGSILEIRHWVLGWGGDCEVVRPVELRRDVEAEIRAMSRTYAIDGAAESAHVALTKIPKPVEMVRDRLQRQGKTRAGERVGS